MQLDDQLTQYIKAYVSAVGVVAERANAIRSVTHSSPKAEPKLDDPSEAVSALQSAWQAVPPLISEILRSSKSQSDRQTLRSLAAFSPNALCVEGGGDYAVLREYLPALQIAAGKIIALIPEWREQNTVEEVQQAAVNPACVADPVFIAVALKVSNDRVTVRQAAKAAGMSASTLHRNKLWKQTVARLKQVGRATAVRNGSKSSERHVEAVSRETNSETGNFFPSVK